MELFFLEKNLNFIISEEIQQSHNLDQLRGHIGAHAIVKPSTGENDLRVVANGFGFVGQVVRVHASSLIRAMFKSRCVFSITLAASATLMLGALCVPVVMMNQFQSVTLGDVA